MKWSVVCAITAVEVDGKQRPMHTLLNGLIGHSYLTNVYRRRFNKQLPSKLNSLS